MFYRTDNIGSKSCLSPRRRHRDTARSETNVRPCSQSVKEPTDFNNTDECATCSHHRSRELNTTQIRRVSQPSYKSDRRKNFGGRNGLYENLIGKFFVFILTTNQFLTQAAVTRVPYFLDVEQALESSRCTVREEVVDIRKVHPTLPPDAVYMPSCVVLNRCSGCCQSDMLQCKPTSAYITKMTIWEQKSDPARSEQITLEFTHHDACECKSYDDTTPICIQRECGEAETWSASDCTCVSKPVLDSICMPKVCGEGEQWDSASCSCVRPVSRACQRRPCPPGQFWNEGMCACKCQRQQCGAMEFWNPNACRCQCKPCHPRRLYHVRFNQNSHTCQCTCRDEHRGRAACRRKNAIFNTETCTCEKNHRGRRG